MERWPHQVKFMQVVPAMIEAGKRRIIASAPTGAGKTISMVDLTEWALARGWPTVIYTPRKILTAQLAETFRGEGIDCGIRAAEYEKEMRWNAPVQVSSPSTEHARFFSKATPVTVPDSETGYWHPHRAKLVIVDEIHLQSGETVQRIVNHHVESDGASVVSFTATPIGVSHCGDDLFVAATKRELRQCGALLPAEVYGCEEIQAKKIKKVETLLEYRGKSDLVWTQKIFGYVIGNYRRLNPGRLPAILFAPGVEESIWFAQQFTEAGIRAAHIDGESAWLDGVFHASSRTIRDSILEQVRAGSIKVICNRFVLREGIDLPCLYHLILATPIGSMRTHDQIVGRVLRAFPGYDRVIIQDHGGAWWRWGSPNADRDWETLFWSSERQATEIRNAAIRDGKEQQPIQCHQCGHVRRAGPQCPKCGNIKVIKARMVIEESGDLRLMPIDVFRPRRIKMEPNTQDKWTQVYWRMKRAKKPMTFRQAEGLFVRENHYWPPHGLHFMPANEADWYRAVCDVESKNLL